MNSLCIIICIIWSLIPKAAVASEIRYVSNPKLPLILVVVETQCGVVKPVITTVVISFAFKSSSRLVPIKLLFTFLVIMTSLSIGLTISFIATPHFLDKIKNQVYQKYVVCI